MSLSLYDVSVASYLQALAGVTGVLAKGEEHAAAGELDWTAFAIGLGLVVLDLLYVVFLNDWGDQHVDRAPLPVGQWLRSWQSRGLLDVGPGVVDAHGAVHRAQHRTSVHPRGAADFVAR